MPRYAMFRRDAMPFFRCLRDALMPDAAMMMDFRCRFTLPCCLLMPRCFALPLPRCCFMMSPRSYDTPPIDYTSRASFRAQRAEPRAAILRAAAPMLRMARRAGVAAAARQHVKACARRI